MTLSSALTSHSSFQYLLVSATSQIHALNHNLTWRLQAGILRKAAGPTGTASLVDLYGTLLSSRLYIPTDVTKLDPRHLSLHLYRRNLDNGALPLPIFSAIQHGA